MTYSVAQPSAIALVVAAAMSFSSSRRTRGFADAAFPSNEHIYAAGDGAPVGRDCPVHERARADAGLAQSGSNGQSVTQNPSARHYAHRHYAYGRREYSDHPVRTVAMGVAGGAADLGSVAAYPFYCFPNYGSCPVRVPYRF